MLGENNLSEGRLSESIADLHYRRVDRKKCSFCPCRALCLCNTPPLKVCLCCCMMTTFYLSTSAFSFYIGHLYGQDHCNSTVFDEL
jgi:hypothetical protein